jgi:hypothetical protein
LFALAIVIISWQDVTRSSIYSGVEECGTKHARIFLFPKSSFRIERTAVSGMFKDFAIILDVIWLSFLTKSATAAMFPQFELILEVHLSCHILTAPFRLKIENTT